MNKAQFVNSREVRELTVTFVLADADGTYEMFDLPAGSRVVGFVLNTKTAWTTGTLAITANSDTLVSAYTLPVATGTVLLTDTSSALPGYETSDRVVVSGTLANGAGAGAEMDVTCLFSLETGTKL